MTQKIATVLNSSASRYDDVHLSEQSTPAHMNWISVGEREKVATFVSGLR
jgi:hypothetical protein